MMIPRIVSLLALLLASSEALPTQPGSCNSPQPLGTAHLRSGVFEGGTALSDFGLEVRVDGTLLNPASLNRINPNSMLDIELVSTSDGNSFRGFLLKLVKDDVDTRGFLSSDSDIVQDDLSLCDSMQAGSLSHVNRDDKVSIAGSLLVEEPMDGLRLEVTVVITNDAVSEWYTSAFDIEARAAAPAFCFPGDSVAEVKDKGSVAMKDLRLGDLVLTDSTHNKFEPIYSFGHNDATASAEFLQLKTASKTLELTKDHMVIVEGNRAVPASAVQLGDAVVTASGDLEAVKAIKEIVRKGAFAPFTPSGTIVVNGVKASSFVAFQDSETLTIGGISTGVTFQWLGQTFEIPHRIWCHHLGPCETEQYVEGVSTWVAFPGKMAQWLVDQEPVVMAVLSVPVFFLFATLWSIGMMLAYPVSLITLLLGARFLSMVRVVKKEIKV